MNDDFVYVDDWVPGVRWDAKYATWDNFTGKPVDGYPRTESSAPRFCAKPSSKRAGRQHPSASRLLLWDGYRPHRATDCFLRWSQQPEDGHTKQRHYPNIDKTEMFDKGYVATQSGHSRGGAVDLTIYHLATNQQAPMGGDHDLMDPISGHRARGLTPIESQNRELLRSIMEESGFDRYDTEWWHYTLRDEPHPDVFFDFPIT
ncbi:MAG: M15 family metallopeptidase [Rhodococcus sp. (in: high G+C Gram-positive bacteria)]|uniref:M15 family metallopeptidase n=1 Tax=Rhodococcus sp. TaxID=1831 RepID=UPI002AD8DF66|nr:M15 family metallopeptidase [Rhodococcus sp. (in: high G+C Gram-positive bacteria)]